METFAQHQFRFAFADARLIARTNWASARHVVVLHRADAGERGLDERTAQKIEPMLYEPCSGSKRT